MALPIFRNMDLPFFLLLLVLVIHTISIEIFQANTVPVVDRISMIWDHFPTGAKDKCRRTVGMHKRCLLPRELHLLHTKPKQVGKMQNILTVIFSRTLEVSMSIIVGDIKEVNHEKRTLTMGVFLYLTWIDSRITCKNQVICYQIFIASNSGVKLYRIFNWRYSSVGAVPHDPKSRLPQNKEYNWKRNGLFEDPKEWDRSCYKIAIKFWRDIRLPIGI